MLDFNERTNLAKTLAKLAGEEIRRILHEENINTQVKGLNDVVTIADLKSESMIVEKILNFFPDDTIISEEKGKYNEGNSEYSWTIDPLDGTMNYSRKMPFYCVSIGYLKNNKPIGGAIYIPELEELYYCERGKGAYCNNTKIQVSNKLNLEDSLATIGFNNRYPDKRLFFNKVHENCMNNMLNVEKLFSTVISLCYVACGKIEAHFELYCFLWDICVGSLLVEEAGGKCGSLNNEEIDYSKVEKQVIIATNKEVHNDFENLLNFDYRLYFCL